MDQSANLSINFVIQFKVTEFEFALSARNRDQHKGDQRYDARLLCFWVNQFNQNEYVQRNSINELNLYAEYDFNHFF